MPLCGGASSSLMSMVMVYSLMYSFSLKKESPKDSQIRQSQKPQNHRTQWRIIPIVEAEIIVVAIFIIAFFLRLLISFSVALSRLLRFASSPPIKRSERSSLSRYPGEQSEPWYHHSMSRKSNLLEALLIVQIIQSGLVSRIIIPAERRHILALARTFLSWN